MFPELRPSASEQTPPDAPLAERLRPRTLDEIVGQSTVAEGSLLRRAIERDRLPSILLWGPPGSGKTTIARAVAAQVGQDFVAFSAVLSGVKEVRAVVAEARLRRADSGRGTVLFVDEIHRFNKSQQDAFLPHVEDGTLVLIGATTENPSFHLNAALLSRCLVLTLDPLSEDAMVAIATRALGDSDRGLGEHDVHLLPEALQALARTSHGDARSLLNRLEALAEAAVAAGQTGAPLDEATIEKLTAKKLAYHDRAGDEHFNLISAFHKSIRGGDPQASLYWLARMLDGGEDPMYLARRIVRIAAEDIGLADPQALQLALAAKETYRFLGTPEGELALAQASVYLATAPKSNAVYGAFDAVMGDIKGGAVHPVPLHIRNAPTTLMKQLGYGKGYVYPHDFDEGVTNQSYLPDELHGRVWYEPSPFGHEKEIARRMEYWARLLQERDETEES
ncbi:MAG: replication-associated recombination protein A [Planctomycetes bacterium]|nr:replication-associated recombination protein A [Planctomycetota bacterium]